MATEGVTERASTAGSPWVKHAHNNADNRLVNVISLVFGYNMHKEGTQSLESAVSNQQMAACLPNPGKFPLTFLANQRCTPQLICNIE